MLLPYFEWCENSALGATIRDSLWLFPVIESFHLVAMAVLGGTVLLVDMRLLGLGLSRRSVATLARDVQPFFVAAVAVMLVSGLLLFSSEAVKCYYSAAFWVKMTFLAAAITFTYSARRRLVGADGECRDSLYGRFVGLTSLLLWFGVGAGGRWIGFS
ncbi:MAG: DUF6644 family protein [Vicinamibacterales bacterium]